ncbi:RNA recognition motif domain [Macleaya cordata]|uniref:RNA recognition motif domain n=1 Tax=Macleaya cordata TaxID=56857 RepID=A0A200QFY7_MACCD|nr:RNA recognition motif domain [Macleaya cordata]
MASAEQPLKKRKLYESVSEPQNLQESSASPLSQEEIMKKKRNKEEIRSLYDCYRRIRFCISHKDARFMPDFEQAYLSLITASRGCTSVQLIVAELIPRYASYCPTALEAAAKVAINMYNWSLAVILRGEDYDVVAFQTAKACIFGLVDICCTASSEAPTSSVIRGICSAVFLNVLTFFINSFEGKNIYQIGDEDIAKVQESSEHFSELKQKVLDEDESTLVRLFKFRALSLLRIFFCCPKNLLAACFELFKSSATDSGASKGGSYFLRQMTSQINATDVTHPLKKNDEARSSTGSIGESTGDIGISEGRLVSDNHHSSEEASLVSKNCLMGMALNKDPSLRDWIFSKYNKICKSMSSEAASEISSALKGIFGSFLELAKEVICQEDSDDDNSSPSKHMNRQYLMPVISNQHESSVEQSGRDSRVHGAYTGDVFNDDRDSANKVSGQPVKSCNSVVPFEPDMKSANENSNYECDGSMPMKDLETREREDSCFDRPSMQHNLVSKELPSPVNRKPLDFRNDALEGINHLGQVDDQHSKSDFVLPPTRSACAGAANISPSPEQHSAVRYRSSHSHSAWYFDGDPAAMDVVSASTQLWLGSLGPDASEAAVRFQFEKFGPMERFLFYPIKDFSLVEYRHIMDAIKAREYMRGSSPWGTCLRIKFLDIGLGSRGSINGVAVGASCHVYIGKVSSQWAKDEILHELARVGFRNPRMVTDLTSESALLMEFETAEEAAIVMAHLRQYRKESGFHGQMNNSMVLNAVSTDVTGSHMDARFVPTPIRVEFRSNNPGSMPNNIVGSPHLSTVHDSPIDNCKTRMSQLSSLLSSLSSKYNISQSSTSFGGHLSRNYNATATRDEDTFPTNTICISLPDSSSQFLTDDELMSVCHLAAGSFGSVVRLTRSNMQMGSCWFVELSSVDAAVAALKNLRSCPVSVFQIEFSQPGRHNSTPFISQSESTAHELVSPGIQLDNRGTTVQGGHPFQSNWPVSGYTEMLDVGTRKVENIGGYDNNMAVDLSHPVSEARSGSHGNEQVWMYKKPETGPQFSAPGILPCPPMAAQGPTIMPPQQVQASPFMRPIYPSPNNSWDTRGLGHPLPLNHISSGIMANNLHVNVPPPPFLPASVTPLAQISGNSMQHFDQVLAMPAVPPLSSPPPPPPDVPPPLPPSPPPLPVCQPPLVPPPPSSPPPLPPSVEASNLDNTVQCLQYQWQGVLCKSGVHYCTIYALREDLDACKYLYGVSEPAEWPARLDMTKRTDFQHVKSTFTSTPPHKREVCRLLPSNTGDHKGFQDFVTYLKQRECAGVIKIPAVKSMWSRLLFILPYSPDICSMLGMAPHPSECLIALVLPKETSFEWV